MKTIPVLLVSFWLLIACEEENHQLVAPDPFVGSWSYTNADLDLDLTFDVSKVDGEYVLSNIMIDYMDVPTNAVFTVQVYEDAVNEFEKIQISGKWTVSPCQTMFCDKWVIISLWDAKVQEKTVNPKTYQMAVAEMTVGTINDELIELENQILIRE